MWPPIPTAGISLIVFLICLIIIFLIKLYKLESQFEPKLIISDPIESIEPKGSKSKAEREWLLKITNNSSAVITNCYVKQKNLVNRNGQESDANGMRFKLNTDRPTNIQSYEHKQSFNIPPRGEEIVSIAGLHETDDNANVIMLYAPHGKAGEGIRNAIPKKFFPHTLTIQVCADNVLIPEERIYKIHIKDGFLKMDKADL